MLKKLLCVSAILLVACDPLDTGDPPSFSSFSASVIGESQIQLSWSAATDDLHPSEELKYVIWVADPDTTLDTANLGTPTFETEEGALSFNLIGLDAGTDYDFLVRASDRANDYSENTNITSTTTAAAGNGLYDREVGTTLQEAPEQIINGKVLLGLVDDIGIIEGTALRWYARGADGTYTRSDTKNIILTSENIVEAHLAPMQVNVSLDDLFLATEAGFRHYRNSSTALTVQDTVFEGIPVAGSIKMHMGSNGLLETITYFTTDRQTYIYQLNEDQGDDDPLFVEHTYGTLNEGSLFQLIDADGDEFLDVVYFQDGELHLARDNGSEFNFETSELIDAIDDDIANSGAYNSSGVSHYMFVHDGDNDGDQDIYLFLRNPSEDITRMLVYEGDGAGAFADPVLSEYNGLVYDNPVFNDVNGDDNLDLIVPQLSSNNVAIYAGPSDRFASSPTYIGIDGAPSRAIAANLDGTSGNDLAVISLDAKSLTVITNNQ